MQYRIVPSCGVSVSEIAFGCGGTAGLMVRGDFQTQVAAVERAIELGINYFDNSPDYGDGVSEVNLGKVLKELGVRPLICTKVEIRPGDMGDIAGHIERSVEASLQRLGTDWVDLVQIHNAPWPVQPELGPREYRILWVEDYFKPGGAMEGLDRIVQAGKTRFTGFICRGGDGRQVRQLLDTDQFNMINLVYNLLNPSAGMALPRGMEVDADFDGVINSAEEHGVGVAIYSPLAGGLLTDDAVAGNDPHPLSGSRRGSAAAEAGRKRSSALRFLQTPDRSLAQAAYDFNLAHSGVTTVLGGFSDIAHLEELASRSGAEPLSTEEMMRVEMAWRANFGV